MHVVIAMLGDFEFKTDTAAFEEIQRTTEFRWSASERLGHRPVSQYLGPGTDTITMPGSTFPLLRKGTGLARMDDLRAMAHRGQPYELYASLREAEASTWGYWFIRSVSETRRMFAPNVGFPQEISFTLTLEHYGTGLQ